MRYKLTLLKDLPDYPAGTVFHYRKGKMMGIDTFEEQEFMGLAGSKSLTYPLCIPRKLINNPTWIKKEVDAGQLLDLKCPICGETRGEISVRPFRYGNGYDGYGNSADVYFEYMCGHAFRQLWHGYC